MKLFILNRPDFEKAVADTRSVHINAFNQLHLTVSGNCIPISITALDCLFRFKSYKDEVYYYDFVCVLETA